MKALTRGRDEAGVHGGARQEVHVGVARMPDPRLDTLARIFVPDKVVSVEIKYWRCLPAPLTLATVLGLAASP